MTKIEKLRTKSDALTKIYDDYNEGCVQRKKEKIISCENNIQYYKNKLDYAKMKLREARLDLENALDFNDITDDEIVAIELEISILELKEFKNDKQRKVNKKEI